MRSLVRNVVVVALALLAAPAARGAELWLHVRVSESGPRPMTVKINVPYTLVERVAPLLDTAVIEDGDIVWNGGHVEIGELREVWQAVRAGSGAVSRNGAVWELVGGGAAEMLVVRETGGSSPAEVRIPARLLDALLSGRNELDFEAATEVISTFGSGELLAVDEDGTRVRIWVDGTPESE